MKHTMAQTQGSGIPRIELYTGLVLQLAFVLFAVIFYQERILYADTAQFASEIIGGGRFYIGHRFIAFFSRILPFCSAQAGLSVKTSMILYSVNLALIYSIPYFILALVWKNRVMANTLLCFQFLFLFRTDYLAISELQHGLAFLLLFWGWAAHRTSKQQFPSRHWATYVLLFLLMNAHPMMIIAFLASAALLRDELRYWSHPDRQLLFPVAVLFFLLSTVVFSTRYESILVADSIQSALSQLHIYQIRLMLHTALTDYYPAIIAAGFGALLMLLGTKMRQLLVVMALIGATGIIVYLRFANKTLTLTFFEVYISIIPWILFLGLQLELPRIRPRVRNAIMSILLLLAGWQGFRVVQHAAFYQERLALYQEVLSTMEEIGCSNAVLPFYRAPMAKIIDFYATPFESYLLGQIDERPENDGLIFTYLLEDSISLENYPNADGHFVGLGIDTVNYYPYSRYPKFSLEERPLCTFEMRY